MHLLRACPEWYFPFFGVSVQHIGRHRIADYWQKIVPEDVFYMRPPKETASTCDACPRIKTHNYNPISRCCTYLPRMPNFAVGMALLDEKTAPAMRQALADGLALPEGLVASPKQMHMSLETNRNHYGQTGGILCPFLDKVNHNCSMYLYRNSVCSTFFCSSEDGSQGREYWEELQSFVGQLEAAAGQWCMTKLGVDVAKYYERMDQLDPQVSSCSEKDGWNEQALSLLWQDRVSAQEEYFIECSRLVTGAEEVLFETLRNVKIRQPQKFDLRLWESLTPELKEEMDSDGPVIGEPQSIDDLWYALQLCHRNLMLSRMDSKS